MIRLGCANCNNCRYIEEDNVYECRKEKEIDPRIFARVWLDEEDWGRNDEPICECYKEPPQEYDEYWEKYAYQERFLER